MTALRAGIDFYSAKPLKPPKVRTYPARPPRISDPVTFVHDGDSLIAALDVGFWAEKLVTIRLYNVFAPELAQPGGPECRNFALNWLLGSNGRPPWPYLIDTVLDANGHQVETFGRVVCIVRSTSGNSLNDDMNAFIDVNGYGHGIGA